ncbi:MAG TPA: hypothetical protein VFR31_10810 [Thermoanaerobaculia bacterium]|nr:hypothetical protein [Thermoanaerobaculia bacterium]
MAADSMVRRGIDIFTTAGDGKTSYDFAQNPIPAGFFCEASKPFTGRVTFKGLPLTTGAPGQIWGADTVIERLDDAVFDANGTAVTRIQFRALSLVSTAPIKTACGSFHVYVSLRGKQRVTTMNIYRTEEGGGNFVAPLAVNTRVTFIPVKAAKKKAAPKLELVADFTFPARPLPWSFLPAAQMKRIGSVSVDTNGDLIPDTSLPGTSNFTAGLYYGECPDPCAGPTCHLDPSTGKQHCTYPTRPPYCEETFCP